MLPPFGKLLQTSAFGWTKGKASKIEPMPLSRQQDTIVAISTPPGRGGIGIVRLSGPEARAIAGPMLRLGEPLAHARARFGHLLDVSQKDTPAILDEVVATYFAGPKSYTSEDVLEIASHGSPVLLNYLVSECVVRGARLAEPGEFTRRAFLAGRLDLTQAEAIDDLIASTTLHQARLAASQLAGSLSREIGPAKKRLIQLIAELEAGIDFAEDDVDVLLSQEIIEDIEEIRVPLVRLQQSFTHGRLTRDGFSLAIVGRPNAGKSSLFNALLHRERAIVTSVPGTTRDLISERLTLRGIPVELIDTAGLRGQVDLPDLKVSEPAISEAENLGIAKSREAIADADCVLLVLDATKPVHQDDLDILRSNHRRPLLVLLNKYDLVQVTFSAHEEKDLDVVRVPASISELDNLVAILLEETSGAMPQIVRTSSLTGLGMQELQDAIYRELTLSMPNGDTAMLTSQRQHQSIVGAVSALRDAEVGVRTSLPQEVFLLSLQSSLKHLDQLTGTTTSSEILDLIFASFCIGK